MTIHRFTVNVPNPTPTAVTATLRLEPVDVADLGPLALDVPKGDLEIRNASLSLDPCADEGERGLKLRLDPLSSVDVHVRFDTGTTGVPGFAAVHLVDRRRGRKEAGGVTLAVVDGLVESPGVVIDPPNPSPIQLAGDVWWVPAGSEPDDPPPGGPIPVGYEVDLVAPITNPTGGRLEEVVVYLEHLGRSQAEFSPTTWNIGGLDPGAVFLATWRIHPNGWTVGSSYASIVAVSQKTDPVRLATRVDLGERDGDTEPRPK